MPKLLYTWYFENFTASVTSSVHFALRHEVSRICTILTLTSDKDLKILAHPYIVSITTEIKI